MCYWIKLRKKYRPRRYFLREEVVLRWGKKNWSKWQQSTRKSTGSNFNLNWLRSTERKSYPYLIWTTWRISSTISISSMIRWCHLRTRWTRISFTYAITSWWYTKRLDFWKNVTTKGTMFFFRTIKISSCSCQRARKRWMQSPTKTRGKEWPYMHE